MTKVHLSRGRDFEIVELSAQDEPAWRTLYADYAAAYSWDEGKAAILWSWLSDPQHTMTGLAAKLKSGRMIGFVHFLEVPRAVHACNHGYIEDLYVEPEYRGRGVARALIFAVVDVAWQKGWPRLRWITEENNLRARAFYEQFAKKCDRVTFELSITDDLRS